MSYGFRKDPFPANIYAFEDESKIAWKYAILGQSAEYSAEIIPVEYSTGLEISKILTFEKFCILQWVMVSGKSHFLPIYTHLKMSQK